MKIALVQMSSQPDRAYNLAEAARLMREAMIGRPDLIVLPEHFDWLGGTVADKRRAADRIPGGEAYVLVQRFAKDNAVWVHDRHRRTDQVPSTPSPKQAPTAGLCYYNCKRSRHVRAGVSPAL